MKAEFQTTYLNEVGVCRATEIGEAFSMLLVALDAICPPGRERALVVTKLQEAHFWAKRSVAVQPENKKP